MLPLPLRRLRSSRTLTALAGGVAVALVVGAAAFALEASALPRPSKGQLLAADYLRWLIRYRLVEAVETIDGRHFSSDCLNSWFTPPGRASLSRGSELIRSDGARLLDIRGRVFVLAAPRTSARDASPAAFELAGCPRALDRKIGDLLQLRRPVGVSATTADGEAAYRLRLRTRTAVIDLFANRAGRPLGITIRAPGFAGSADIAAVPLTPTALARLTHVGRPLSTEHGHRL